jgi:hypothetical protein
METWAHGLDIADALGVTREPTERLRHIAYLGFRALGNGFAAHGLDVPDAPVRVVLSTPDGALWTFGPPDAADRVVGPALDFCFVVTQRRHRADLALVATGPVANAWLGVAQAFAGPPGTGREPRRARRRRPVRSRARARTPRLPRDPDRQRVRLLRRPVQRLAGDAHRGRLDVLTGDYLAELTMLILGRDRATDPTTGYAKTFLRQMETALSVALGSRVPPGHERGWVNPTGLADALRALADRLGTPVRIGVVTGTTSPTGPPSSASACR